MMSKQLTAILIDDEESARDILANLLDRFCPSIQLLQKFTQVKDAVEAIPELKPDVVFLDIEMPNYAGYEIVNFFDRVPFEIIFVTAYDKYAVKAFELTAVDYLLKPIDVNRLKQAVVKVSERIKANTSMEQLNILSETLQSKKARQIAVFEKGYRRFIPVSGIVAIEAQEAYAKIYLKDDNNIMVSHNLKHYEKMLEQENHFFRSHKSWLINLNEVDTFSLTRLEVQMKSGLSTKLSKYRKASFQDELR